jgi:hypothetical protein
VDLAHRWQRVDDFRQSMVIEMQAFSRWPRYTIVGRAIAQEETMLAMLANTTPCMATSYNPQNTDNSCGLANSSLYSHSTCNFNSTVIRRSQGGTRPQIRTSPPVMHRPDRDDGQEGSPFFPLQFMPVPRARDVAACLPFRSPKTDTGRVTTRSVRWLRNR